MWLLCYLTNVLFKKNRKKKEEILKIEEPAVGSSILLFCLVKM